MGQLEALKPIEYYEENKKIFDNNYNEITKKYINRFVIGCCSYLFLKYSPTSYDDFYQQYLNDYKDNRFDQKTCHGSKYHGRSVEQLKLIAQRYYEDINDPNITLEQCFDDIVNHTIIETYDGHQAELYIAETYRKYGDCDVEGAIDDLDTRFGVDLIVKKKDGTRTHYIQVKPSSTFSGNGNESLLKDRADFFEREKGLRDYVGDETASIEYMVYDKTFYNRHKKFKFLKNNGKFRHRLSDLCNTDGTMKLKFNNSQFEEICVIKGLKQS